MGGKIINKDKQLPNGTFSVRMCSLILIFVSFVLYANTLRNGFVLDDFMVARDNSYVSDGIKAIPDILTTPHLWGFIHSQNDEFRYRPLPIVLFAVEHQFFGANPTVCHFVNILLFVGCVLMLFRFIRHLFGNQKPMIAFVGALFFAVHPIHTEVVANIKSGDELMSYFFAFWSLNIFISYVQTGKYISLISGTFTLFLAYLSKETVISFLVIIPLIFFFYFDSNKKRSLSISIATALATIVFLILRKLVLDQYRSSDTAFFIEFTTNALVSAPSLIVRLATAIFVLGKYLKLLFIPHPLLCNYSFKSIPFVSFGDYQVILILVLFSVLKFGAVKRLMKVKKDLLAFGFYFFLLTITLFLNLFFLVGNQMAERFLFFPSTGFCIVIAAVLDYWVFKEPPNSLRQFTSNKIALLFIPVTVVFSGITVARNNDWQDNYTLFKTDLEHSPDDCRLNFYYATDLSQNRYNEESDTIRKIEMDKESLRYLYKATDIYPEYNEAYAEMGRIYERENRLDSAEKYDLKAITLQPKNSIATYNLGRVYYIRRNYERAIECFKKTIILEPKYTIAFLNLSKCYGDWQKPDSAIVYYQKTLALDPNSALAQHGIAVAFYELHSFDSAAVHFQAAVTINPNDLDEKNNLGVVLLNLKRFPEAIQQFIKIINTNPNYNTAYTNLGNAYFYSEKYSEAIKVFKYQLQRFPNDKSNLQNLIESFNKLGETDSAKVYTSLAK